LQLTLVQLAVIVAVELGEALLEDRGRFRAAEPAVAIRVRLAQAVEDRGALRLSAALPGRPGVVRSATGLTAALGLHAAALLHTALGLHAAALLHTALGLHAAALLHAALGLHAAALLHTALGLHAAALLHTALGLHAAALLHTALGLHAAALLHAALGLHAAALVRLGPGGEALGEHLELALIQHAVPILVQPLEQRRGAGLCVAAQALAATLPEAMPEALPATLTKAMPEALPATLHRTDLTTLQAALGEGPGAAALPHELLHALHALHALGEWALGLRPAPGLGLGGALAQPGGPRALAKRCLVLGARGRGEQGCGKCRNEERR
jgi:hypothetical protein